MTTMPEKKKCSRCGEVKPADQFYKNAHYPSGLGVECKPCKREDSRLRYRKKREEAGLSPGRSQRRRPLLEFTTDAGWRLRKDIERLERVFADERFPASRNQVAARVRSHLAYAAEVCQDLLSRLDTEG